MSKPKNYHYSITIDFNLDRGYQTPHIIKLMTSAAGAISEGLETGVVARLHALSQPSVKIRYNNAK